MNIPCKKKYYNFKNVLNYYFFEHKTFFILFVGFFLIGLVIGIFSYVKFNKILDITSIATGLKTNLLLNKVGIFSFAFNTFFKYFFNVLIIIILSLCYYIYPLVFLYVGYLGYLFGSSCVVIVLVLGAGGIIGLALFFVPIRIFINFLIINVSCICEKRSFESHKFGKYYKSGGELAFNLNTFLIVVCAVLLLCFLEAIILPQSIKNVLRAI